MPAGTSCTGDAGFSTGVLTCLAWDLVALGVTRFSGLAMSGSGLFVLGFALLERVVRVGMPSSLVTGSGLDISTCDPLARERVVRVGMASLVTDSGLNMSTCDVLVRERVVRVGMASSLVTGSGFDISTCDVLACERVVRVLVGTFGTTGSTSVSAVTLFFVADLKR